MTKMVLLIVPPGIGGVRDYAEVLASHLCEIGHNAQIFVWREGRVDDIDVYLPRSDCVYLQYSGYGYSRYGAPMWMLRALKSKRVKIKKLGVFFHELFAFKAPWRSAFWYSPAQRMVSRGIANLSDGWFTNRGVAAHYLDKWAASGRRGVLPVFSNVGEPTKYEVERHSRIVLFGSPPLRERSYKKAGDALFKWARTHELVIHDIGSEVKNDSLRADLEKGGVICHGRLDATEVGSILDKSMFGLISYEIDKISKSGVFAAFCAHGVCPVVFSDKIKNSDLLSLGKHYLSSNILWDHSHMPEYSAVGCAARDWYHAHAVRNHVDSFISFMG